MSSNADIRLDFNHMMSESIGGPGIQRAEIDELRPQLSQIHRGLSDLYRLGQMPFLELPSRQDLLAAVQERTRVLRRRFEKALVLGIGGSALGPRFLIDSLGGNDAFRVTVCDCLDPRAWAQISEENEPAKTVLIAVSKSGKTLETWAAFIYFVEKFRKVLGDRVWENVAVVTAPHEGPLRRLAKERGLASFEIPPGVGGRFSVLSPVGLFPAALSGVDVESLLAGARRMEERCHTDDPWMNPALMSAALHHRYAAGRSRNVRILLSYGEGLKEYAPWFAQLWAESLGKRTTLNEKDGKAFPQASTPVCSTGPQDQHSQLQLHLDGPEDKVVTFLGVEEEAREETLPSTPEWASVLAPDGASLEKRGIHELQTASRLATEEALRASGRPNQTILLKRLDAYSVGQLLMMAELETVYAGQLLNVNPFDQPAVEQIKRNVREFLGGRITPSKSRNYMI
jgi:glucose-6-phosphate isomerase